MSQNIKIKVESPSCLRAKIEEDWWVRGYDSSPREVEVIRLKSGKYGVRFS